MKIVKLLQHRLDRLVLAVAADMPIETDWSSSLDGSWYLPPWQHALEVVVLGTLFHSLFARIWRRIMDPASKDMQLMKMKIREAVAKGRRQDAWIVAGLTATLLLTAWHKWVRGNVIFLLQPCHVSLVALVFTMLAPIESPTTHAIFNLQLQLTWGTLLAILMPDLRDYSAPFEVENFFIEHYALLLVPIFLIISGRFVVWRPRWDVAIAGLLVSCLYHAIVLGPLAVITSRNLNYMLSPPPGALQGLGPFYRMVTYLVCLGVTFAMRYFIIEGALRALKHAYPQEDPVRPAATDATTITGLTSREKLA